MTSRAVRHEYYISEAVLAREQIRAWARDPARQATVLAVTGVSPDVPSDEAQPQQGDGGGVAQDGVDTPAPSGAYGAPWAAPAPASAPAPAPVPVAAPKVATTLGAPPPAPRLVDKKPAAVGAPGKAKAKTPGVPTPSVLPPAPVLSSGIRVRIEVNDEMFTVSPSDLAALGLDPVALAHWYARKAGRTAGGGAAASPSAVKLAAARTAVTGGEEAGSPRRGVKRLSDALAALAGPSGGSPQSEEENMPPPGGLDAAMEPPPASKKATPWNGGAAGPAQPPPPPSLLPEHERAFTQTLLSLTGHRGECTVPDLVRALAGAMDQARVADCLQVFEANNKLMVADQMVFIT